MNYQESLDYIKSLTPTLERPTMARMKLYFEELGKPQNQLASLHVGGTNGKGSVSTFLASMLAACGKKVGKFTGPHLLKFNERIVVNGADIDDQSFAQMATIVLDQSLAFAQRHRDLGPLTWFEFLTAMAVQYFNQEKVDYAVFEVGLGGRFDATNALENVIVSTITNVDLDHMHLLGNTVGEIAAEKAGIIKTAPLVTTAGGAALAVLEERAASAGVPLIALYNPWGDFAPALFRDFYVTIKNAPDKFERLVQSRISLLQKQLFGQDALALSGAYQRLNALTALLALCATDFFGEQSGQDQNLFFENLRQGLVDAYWPGRYEIVADTSQILDGAHNPHGARALRLSLEDMFGPQRFVFIFAAFQNKDLRAVLSQLVREGDYILAPRLTGERPFHKFADIEAICKDLKAHSLGFEDFASASAYGHQLIAKGGGNFSKMVVVTGSFATVREAKAASG
jgi:dihydrofolate synthase / folylpolyglutamate synthase